MVALNCQSRARTHQAQVTLAQARVTVLESGADFENR